MDNSPKFNFYSFLIMELIKERIFPVYEIINKFQIEKEIWLDKLIINLFGTFFDFSIGIRLYDCMIAFGLNFLINFTLGFLKNYQNIILNFKDKNSFISFFRGKYKFKNDNDIYIERERIIKLALEFNISQATIMRISDKYNHQMKMRNLNELIYKNNITNKKDNYKIINKELEIIELISESINGKEYIEEIKKEENNIFDNNKNMKGKRKNIKNYKNNIENHLINNNLNEIEIEKNENEINTNKKRTLSDRIVINEIVDDEDDEQLNLRKVFPLIKNNHLNFDVNRINKNQNDIIDEKEIEESQNSKIKKEEEEEEIKEIIKDKKEKEEIKEIIKDKKEEEEDEIKEIIKDKKEKSEDEIKEIIKDKKEKEEDEIKEIIKDKKEKSEDEIKEIIKDKKEKEENEIKEIIKDKKEKEDEEIKEIIKNKKENEKDEIKEIIKDKKEENKIEEDKKEENNSKEENTIELESEDSVIPIDNSSSDISFEEENMIKMSKKLNHG